MIKYIVLIVLSLNFLNCKSQNVSISKPVHDTILKQNLEQILTKDQTLRLILPEVEEMFGDPSAETDYFWSLIHEQDSINEAEIIKIIDNYGWLGRNRVGEKANQCIWLVIQHAPLETQEKYVPYLRKSVDIGESQGWQLAFLEDRIKMRKGEPQIYGTQGKYNEQTGKVHIFEIADVKNINKRRKAIGLEPIEEYAEQNGYIFNQKEE